MASNPFVAAFIGWNEAFCDVVDPVEDAQETGEAKNLPTGD